MMLLMIEEWNLRAIVIIYIVCEEILFNIYII